MTGEYIDVCLNQNFVCIVQWYEMWIRCAVAVQRRGEAGLAALAPPQTLAVSESPAYTEREKKFH